MGAFCLSRGTSAMPLPPPPPSLGDFKPPPADKGRKNLLGSIEGFSANKLKKTQTNDRSAPQTSSKPSGGGGIGGGGGGMFGGGVPSLPSKATNRPTPPSSGGSRPVPGGGAPAPTPSPGGFNPFAGGGQPSLPGRGPSPASRPAPSAPSPAAPSPMAPSPVAPSPAASSSGNTENGWTFHDVSEFHDPPPCAETAKTFPSGGSGGFLKAPGPGGGAPPPTAAPPRPGGGPPPRPGGAPPPRPGSRYVFLYCSNSSTACVHRQGGNFNCHAALTDRTWWDDLQ